MADLETRLAAALAPKWRIRRMTADLGDGRELVVCSDGSWLLASAANECVERGQCYTMAAAKVVAERTARALGWL